MEEWSLPGNEVSNLLGNGYGQPQCLQLYLAIGIPHTKVTDSALIALRPIPQGFRPTIWVE